MSDELNVFLCHSSGDKPAVRYLHRTLSSIDGISSWLDETTLLPGQDWRLEITKAVRHSDIVIVCLSKSSINKRGFVQREIRMALDAAEEQPEGTIYIIPAFLEPCELPERLSQFHYVKLYELGGTGRLLAALQRRSFELGLTINIPSAPTEEEVLQILTHSLKNKLWQQADQYTALYILKVAQCEEKGSLSQTDFEALPCTTLLTVDRLWREASNDNFGISVQSHIWRSIGGNPDADSHIFKEFGIKLGWENPQQQRWLRWGELDFSLTGPLGHLPTPPRWWELWEGFRKGEDYLYYRIEDCIDKDT